MVKNIGATKAGLGFKIIDSIFMQVKTCFGVSKKENMFRKHGNLFPRSLIVSCLDYLYLLTNNLRY